jgi:NitT/TauT family transport system permease protein
MTTVQAARFLPGPAVRRRLPWRTVRRAGLGAAGIVGVFGAAQLAEWAARVNQSTFPLPSTVAAKAWDLISDGAFLSAVGSTLAAWGEAMAITVAIAVPAGLLLGSLPTVEAALRPVIEFLRPVPAVIIFPLTLLIAQDNGRAEVAVIVFASVWPVLINTVYGLREVDPIARQTLRSFGFGPLAVAFRVSLPSAAPFIATGVRVAAGLSFIAAIAVELVASGINGIGAFAALSQAGTDNMSVLLAVAFWSGVLGMAVNAVLTGAERRMFRWHHALTAASQGGP